MKIPNTIKVRFLLTFDRLSFTKFYWFEMKNDDFYWGSSYKSSRNEKAMINVNESQVTVTVPDDFSSFPKLNGKYSYHESGTVHYKFQLDNGLSIYNEHAKWQLKGNITKPVRFFTIISKTLNYYDKKINNPNKNKSYALSLNFDPKQIKSRVYFEFFLSPAGTFELPETLIKFDKSINDLITHTVSENLILIIRYAVMANLKDWHPDKEITIIPN